MIVYLPENVEANHKLHKQFPRLGVGRIFSSVRPILDLATKKFSGRTNHGETSFCQPKTNRKTFLCKKWVAIAKLQNIWGLGLPAHTSGAHVPKYFLHWLWQVSVNGTATPPGVVFEITYTVPLVYFRLSSLFWATFSYINVHFCSLNITNTLFFSRLNM